MFKIIFKYTCADSRVCCAGGIPKSIYLHWKTLQQRYRSTCKKPHPLMLIQLLLSFVRLILALHPKETFSWYNLCLYEKSFLEWHQYINADKSLQDNFLSNPDDTNKTAQGLSCYQAGIQAKITIEELRIKRRGGLKCCFLEKSRLFTQQMT